MTSFLFVFPGKKFGLVDKKGMRMLTSKEGRDELRKILLDEVEKRKGIKKK